MTHISELNQAQLSQLTDTIIGRAGLKEELHQAHLLTAKHGTHSCLQITKETSPNSHFFLNTENYQVASMFSWGYKIFSVTMQKVISGNWRKGKCAVLLTVTIRWDFHSCTDMLDSHSFFFKFSLLIKLFNNTVKTLQHTEICSRLPVYSFHSAKTNVVNPSFIKGFIVVFKSFTGRLLTGVALQQTVPKMKMKMNPHFSEIIPTSNQFKELLHCSCTRLQWF